MKRNFIYLGIVTIAALLMLFVFSTGEQTPTRTEADALLLAGVAGRINQVERVEIISAGSTTVASLHRNDEAWVVDEMAGYRADWPKLQSLLAALATARVVEAKTDKPEFYARLGVEDISAADAGGVLVKLGFKDESAGILIGHKAQGRQGQYVRLQTQQASALVDQEFDVPTSALDWLDTRIIDINASEVAEVEVLHPDKERVLLTRISADQTDFDLVGLPENRELRSSWAVNSLASVLSMLDFQSVRTDEAVDWASAVNMRLLVFSGMEIMVDITQTGDEYLLRLSASYPGANIAKSGVETSTEAGEQPSIELQAANDVAARVEDINRKTGGWVYGITKQKYDAMAKRTEDLLKPLAES